MKLVLARAAITIVLVVAMLGFGLAAFADPSVGNSGHSNNGSTQCKAGGNNHCPPFGGGK